MKNKIIFAASLLMATAVILGALGAHALKSRLQPDALLSFETGVRYHLIHGIALLVLALLTDHLGDKKVKTLAILFTSGILCFSGSIYLFATRPLYGMEGQLKFLGPITPLGGVLFIIAWILLAVYALKRK